MSLCRFNHTSIHYCMHKVYKECTWDMKDTPHVSFRIICNKWLYNSKKMVAPSISSKIPFSNMEIWPKKTTLYRWCQLISIDLKWLSKIDKQILVRHIFFKRSQFRSKVLHLLLKDLGWVTPMYVGGPCEKTWYLIGGL
jgi:hypothetical protein